MYSRQNFRENWYFGSLNKNDCAEFIKPCQIKPCPTYKPCPTFNTEIEQLKLTIQNLQEENLSLKQDYSNLLQTYESESKQRHELSKYKSY